MRWIAALALTVMLSACSDTPTVYEMEARSGAAAIERGTLEIAGGDARLQVAFRQGPALERRFALVDAPAGRGGYLLAQPEGPTLSFRPTNTPGFWELEPLALDRDPNPFAEPTLWRLAD